MLSKARAHCAPPPLGARLLSHHRPTIKSPPPSELEQYKTVKRRIAKAEREERMDITKALTPPKTYMGGFTRPQEIRVSNWWPGGRYAEAGKGYEKPPDSAYEPHTVVLLESRYDVVHQIGRADCLEHVVVVCRESDLPRVLRAYNSHASPELEAMDNARWPWAKQKSQKQTKWWDMSASREEEIQKLWAGEGEGFEISEQELTKLENEAADAEKALIELKARWRPVTRSADQNRRANPRNPPRLARSTSPTRTNQSGRNRQGAHGLAASAGGPPPRRPNDGIRLFHTYLPLQAEDGKSTTSSERAQIPTSSWSKPMKESQDANDDVVPVYYVERKRQLDDISERKEEEGSLMAELSAGILSEGIAAQTRGREEKIPVEVREMDGVVRHPSGFEPPTPETEFHPVASKPDVEADPLLTTVKLHWDEALAPSEDTAATPDVGATASVGSSSLKTTRSFHTSAFLRAQEASDLPFHVLNAPTPPPQQDGAVAEAAAEEDAEDAEKEWELEENEESASRSQLSVGRSDIMLGSDRSRFLKTLPTRPFWRPVMSATFSTRPLALTFGRLVRGQERGTPFYATIVPEDRKDGKSFTSRMRQLRLRRMRSLLLDVGRLMRGDRGGFVGIRFNPSDLGRGIGGEGFADQIPHDKRVIKIGVGEWVKGSEELKSLVREEAEEAELRDGVQVFGLDEFGYRTDGVAWPAPSENTYRPLGSLVFEGATQEELTKKQMQMRLEDYIRRHGRLEVARGQTVRHNSVYYPPADIREPRDGSAVETEVEASADAEVEVALADLISDKPEPTVTQAEA